jgi:hypothetical protein
VGTTLGKNQEPMPGGVQAVSKIAGMELSYQFAQPGLVSPDYQPKVMIILQNCGDEDITLPRCLKIGFLENVKNPHFNEMNGKQKSKQMRKFQNQNPCCIREGKFFPLRRRAYTCCVTTSICVARTIQIWARQIILNTRLI